MTMAFFSLEKLSFTSSQGTCWILVGQPKPIKKHPLMLPWLSGLLEKGLLGKDLFSGIRNKCQEKGTKLKKKGTNLKKKKRTKPK